MVGGNIGSPSEVIIVVMRHTSARWVATAVGYCVVEPCKSALGRRIGAQDGGLEVGHARNTGHTVPTKIESTACSVGVRLAIYPDWRVRSWFPILPSPIGEQVFQSAHEACNLQRNVGQAKLRVEMTYHAAPARHHGYRLC